MNTQKDITRRAPDVEVQFAFNGARMHPAADGYHPMHLIDDHYLTTGIHHYFDLDAVPPDGSAEGTITFIVPEAYPHCLWVGKQIPIQEGERVVGSAVVTRIMNPILDANASMPEGNTMEYRRYGKMRMSDYMLSWIAILILLLFSVVGLVLRASAFWVVLPILLAVIRFLSIWLPNRETFSMQGGVITARSGLRKKELLIDLPQELTLIISLADLCPPLAIRTAVEHQTHILKEKYAVTILKRLPLEHVLEQLHRNGMRKHSMRSIQYVFDEHQILYSCVCDQALLNRLTEGRECLVILPEKLTGTVNVQGTKAQVYVEESS